MPSFSIRRGDTAPALEAILRDSTGALAILANATEVRFLMRRRNQELKVNALATDIDGATATYQWQAADTDEAGVFHSEFQVTWNDGRIQTFPNGSAITVVVTPDVGP